MTSTVYETDTCIGGRPENFQIFSAVSVPDLLPADRVYNIQNGGFKTKGAKADNIISY